MIRSIWINANSYAQILEHVELYGGNVNQVVNEAISAYLEGKPREEVKETVKPPQTAAIEVEDGFYIDENGLRRRK